MLVHNFIFIYSRSVHQTRIHLIQYFVSIKFYSMQFPLYIYLFNQFNQSKISRISNNINNLIFSIQVLKVSNINKKKIFILFKVRNMSNRKLLSIVIITELQKIDFIFKRKVRKELRTDAVEI